MFLTLVGPPLLHPFCRRAVDLLPAGRRRLSTRRPNCSMFVLLHLERHLSENSQSIGMDICHTKGSRFQSKKGTQYSNLAICRYSRFQSRYHLSTVQSVSRDSLSLLSEATDAYAWERL